MKFIKGCFICIFLLLSRDAYSVCDVSATGINFGTYESSSPVPLDSTGTLTIDCDESPPPVVTVSLGPSGTSGMFNPRQMSTSYYPDLMNYNVFTDSSMGTIWGDGTSGTAIILTPKVTKNKPFGTVIYARVPAGQNLPIGTYSDTLTVTILW